MKKYLNVLSGIAILFVVLIHGNAFYIMNVHNTVKYIEVGYLINMVDKIIHIAVPMFLLIAGYKYSLSTTDSKKYIVKRLKSIGPIFLIITSIFLVYKIYSLEGFITIGGYISGIIESLIGYNYVYPLWYIPLYFFVLIVYSLLSNCLAKKKVSILLISISFFWVLISLFNVEPFTMTTTPLNFIYYLVFFDIGYNMDFIESKIGKYKKIVIYTWIISMVLLTFISSSKINLLAYNTLVVVTGCISMYFISKRIGECRILEFLGKNSMYIFIFHEPLLSKLLQIILSKSNYNSYVVTLSTSIIVILVILVIIVSINYIKRVITNCNNNLN